MRGWGGDGVRWGKTVRSYNVEHGETHKTLQRSHGESQQHCYLLKSKENDTGKSHRQHKLH